MSLIQALENPQTRREIVADAARVLDAEVADKGGMSGMVVKASFKMVRGLSPDFITKTIDALLDDFATRIEPFYLDWEGKPGGQSCASHFVQNGPAVADALLAITDERAKKSDHRALVKTYQKLRPKGREHVIASMPRVGDLVGRHASKLR